MNVEIPPDDDFADRLGWIVLKAYASGIKVQGDWVLLDSHDEVPDIVVEIEPVSVSYDAQRVTDTDSRLVTAFKSYLQSFLLREFGTGTAIRGDWQVRFVPNALPSWDVTIQLPELDADEQQFLRGMKRP